MEDKKKKIVTKVELRLVNKGSLKASGSFTIGKEWMRVNCTVIGGTNGPFVSLPRYKGKDKDGKDKWYTSVWFINEEARKEVEQTILDEYAAMTRVAKNSASGADAASKNDIPAADLDDSPF
jgi:DNA-binding cell septation regulator SpoVG